MAFGHGWGSHKGWLGLFTTTLLLAGCSRPKRPPPPDYTELRRREPVSEAFGIVYRYSDSAQLKARLTAPHDVERWDASKKENAHEMDRSFVLVFYNPTGAEESRITGKRGLFYRQAGVADAFGNVVVTNVRGDKLETERLHWIRDKNLITSDGFVKITTKEEIIYGEGMESNTSFTRYTIRKIKGTIAVKE